MVRYILGMAFGVALVAFGFIGLFKQEAQRNQLGQKTKIDRAVAAENSKKAEDARRALSSPLPGKVFDLDNKNNK